MVFTPQQEKCFMILMFKLDALLNSLVTFDEEDGNWLSLLDKKLDQGSSLLQTASAGVALGVALAPATAGVSLAISGLLGTVAVGVTVAQAVDGCIHWLSSLGETQAPFPDDEAALAAFRLSSRVGLMEVADAIVVYYSHIINEVIEESSIPVFAQYGASRVMKKFKEELKRQLQEHKDPKAAMKVILTPEVFIDYLMQSKTVSENSEKITIKKEYYPNQLFSSRDKYVKWAYSRARVVLPTKDSPIGLSFYATANERGYGFDTTLPYYGYIMPQVFCALTKTIEINNLTLGLLQDSPSIASNVRPHLTLNYPVTWQEIEDYRESFKSTRQSLNAYLTDKMGIRTIAICHDDTLKKKPLKGGDYSYVNFRYAKLEECDLEDTNWEGARLSYAVFDLNKTNEHTCFKGAFLEFCQLSRLTLIGDWSNARLNSAILTDCIISSRLINLKINWEWVSIVNLQMEKNPLNFEELSNSYLAHLQAEEKNKNSLAAWQLEQTQIVEKQAQLNQSFEKRIDGLAQRPEIVLSKLIRDHLNQLRKNFLPQPYVELYVSPVGGIDKTKVLLWDRLDQFIENPSEFAYLVEGALGCGKTLSVARYVLEKTEDEMNLWTMLVLPLWKIKDLTDGNLVISSLRKMLDFEQIKLLKQRPCFLVLDGLDACGVNINQHYILEEIYSSRKEWLNLKVLITATSSFIAQIQDFPQRLRLDVDMPFPAESQGMTLPFDDVQIRKYFALYFPRHFLLSDPNLVERYPVDELYQMARDPIMAHIICEVFSGKGLGNKLPETPGAFSKAFMALWYQNVQCKAKLYEYNFQQTDILLYIRKIALNMHIIDKPFIIRKFDTENSVLQNSLDELSSSRNFDSFSYMFSSPVWKKAGTVTPLLVTVNKNTSPETVKYQFRHLFFYFFALSLEFIESLEHDLFSVSVDIWNHHFISEKLFYTFMKDFLEEKCQAAPDKRALLIQSLCDMVSLSIQDNSKGCAASHAMTFLKYLAFDFKNHPIAKTWQGICAPDADLSHAKLAGLDWSMSNFERAKFVNAEIAGMNLKDIKATDTRFVSDASLHPYVPGRPKVVVMYPSGHDIFTYGLPVSAGSKKYKIVNAGIDGKIYASFEGDQDEILSMQWGPSGLISAGTRGTIHLWSSEGKKIKTFKPGGKEKERVNALSWYVNENLFASGGNDHLLRVWDIDKNSCTYETDEQMCIRSVLFGNLTPVLLSGGDNKQLRVRSFRLKGRSLSPDSGESPILQFDIPHESEIYSMDLSSNEQDVVVGCQDGTMHIHHLNASSRLSEAVFENQLLGHKNTTVNALIWNKQNQSIISGGNDSTIRVWNPRTGAQTAIFYGDGSPIYQFCLSADARRIIVGQDRMLSVWQLDSVIYISPYKHEIEHCITYITTHHHYLFTGHVDGSVFLWRVDNPEQKTSEKIFQHESAVKCIVVSHNGKYISSLDTQNEIRIREHDIDTGEHVVHIYNWGVIKPNGDVCFNFIAWINEGSHIGHCGLAIAASDGKIYLWKHDVSNDVWFKDQAFLWTQTQEPQEIRHIISQNQGMQFAAAGGLTFKVWYLLKDPVKPIYESIAHQSLIINLLWSPDNLWLASVDEDQRVYIWSTTHWDCVFKDEQPSGTKQVIWVKHLNKDWLMICTLEDIRIFEVLARGISNQAVTILDSGAYQCIEHQNHVYLVDKKSIDVMRIDGSSLKFVTRFGEGMCARGADLSNVKIKSEEARVLEIHGARLSPKIEKKNSFLRLDFSFFSNSSKKEQFPPMKITPQQPIYTQPRESIQLSNLLKKEHSIWELKDTQSSDTRILNHGLNDAEETLVKIDIVSLVSGSTYG